MFKHSNKKGTYNKLSSSSMSTSLTSKPSSVHNLLNWSAAISTTLSLKCWLLTLALSKMRFISFVCMRDGQNATLKSAMFIPLAHMILSELLRFGLSGLPKVTGLRGVPARNSNPSRQSCLLHRDPYKES